MRVGEKVLFEEKGKMEVNSDAKNLGKRIMVRCRQRSLESKGTSDEL